MESDEPSDAVSNKTTFTSTMGYTKGTVASRYANVKIVVEIQIDPQENGASIHNILIDQANASVQQASAVSIGNSPLQVPNSNNKPVPPVNTHGEL